MRTGFLVLILSFSAAAVAQLPAVSGTVSTPNPGMGHDYIENNIETVNPADGNVSIRMDIPLPKTRGFNIPFKYTYDSSSVFALPFGGVPVTPFMHAGWGYSVPTLSVQVTTLSYLGVDTDAYGDNGEVDCPSLVNYVFQGPTGHRDNLGLTLVSDLPNCSNPMQSMGFPEQTSNILAGLQAVTPSDWLAGNFTNPVDVIDADGTDYHFPSYQPPQQPITSPVNPNTATPPTTITDRNGNQIQLQAGGFTYVDSTGRTILSGAALVGGLSQPYQMNWQTISYGGYSRSWVLLPHTVLNPSECPQSGTSNPSSGTVQAVTSIQLPNGQQYRFQYDPYFGLVNKVSYPGGGYVRYVWGINSLSALIIGDMTYTAVPITNPNNGYPIGSYNQPSGYCTYHFDMPAIVQRFVSYDGITEVEEQDFSYTTNWNNPVAANGWSQKTTTAVTHDLLRGVQHQTVYTYSPGFAGTNYSGAPTDAGEIPLEKTIQYYDNTTNGSETVGTLLRTVNKQWADIDLISQQQTLDNITGLVSETDWQYNANGMVTEKDDYDFGQGARGAPLRETVYQYHTFSNPYITDKPDSVQLLDGGRNVVAGVSYTYDPVHANMLTASRWLNANGTSSLTTSYQYDPSFGNVTQVTDPQGNRTQYSYNDQFADTCTYTPPSSTYVTQITEMPTNGVQHQQNFTYFCASGLLATSQDENLQMTSYVYQDPLNRLTTTRYPLPWGTSTVTYNDTANNVESKRLDQGGAVWADSITRYDGIHRPISQASASGETLGWNRKDTCYDGESHVLHSIYPYQSSQPYSSDGQYCTMDGDTYSYDGLGRATQVMHSDSTYATTSYMGRAVDVKDEGNGTRPAERITQSDALGRLLSVCEVTGQAQNGVSPASCGLDYSGTGFLTQYQYSAAGDLMNVTQGAESRSFTYDMTSRLLTTTNPENGTLTYTYDTDLTCDTTYLGELISKTDARGVRTCMQYDALHRVTGKSYMGGSATAPAVSYNYDQTSAFGRSLTYTTGKLSSESTGGANPTASVFSYDNVGHVIDNSQCTPQNCANNSMFAVTYPSYNVLGEPTSASDGAGHTYTYTYNAFGHLSSLVSSLSDPTHPATLLANLHYNAFGLPVTSQIGSVPLTDLRTYDVRGRLGAVWVGNATANPTDASTTVTVSGSENGHGAPSVSTGTITITGTENSADVDFQDDGSYDVDYDSGLITVTVGSQTYYVTYAQADTPASIASHLVSYMNGGPVVATVTGSDTYSATISLTSTATGPAANYALSTSAMTSDSNFNSPSFTASLSGATMTGGKSVSGPWDSGTVSLDVNNAFTYSAPYGSTDTPSTIAASLAAAVNNASGLLTAAASGAVVTLTSSTPGAMSNYSVTSTSASTAGFTSPSFSAAVTGGGLSGGVGASVYALDLAYMPDGNVESSNDSVNGQWLYQYDDFNRLSTAVSSTGFGCAESYDRYGNRVSQTAFQGSCLSPQYQPSLNNQYPNQFNYEPGLNGTSSGNVTWDGGHQYAYDAESRVSLVDNGSTATYVYDAEGRRVRKIEGGSTVDYLYDLSGHVITEINSSGGWDRGEVYAGGMHVATYNNGTTYFTHADWLGTERVRTTVAGGIYSTWTSYPFGEGSSTANPSTTHFTGKERDTESGLDNFGARYYGSNMGRFMSPDWSAKAEPVPYSKLDDPQTLNLYAYVRNNPVSGLDPSGHEPTLDGIPLSVLSGQTSTENFPAPNAGLMAMFWAKQQEPSKGLSFWGHMSNLLHFHAWNYLPSGSVTETQVDGGVVKEPNPTATAVTDAAAVVSNAAPKVGKVMGPVGSVVSVYNDPTNGLNWFLNGLGLVPGLGWQATGISVMNDYGFPLINDLKDSIPTGPLKLYDSPGVFVLPVQDGGCLAAGGEPC